MKKKLLKAISFFILGIIFLPIFCFSYAPEPTHKVLTLKTIELYNKFFDPDLTQKEVSQIIEGSVKEDTPPRWINHFYDPQTGLG